MKITTSTSEGNISVWKGWISSVWVNSCPRWGILVPCSWVKVKWSIKWRGSLVYHQKAFYWTILVNNRLNWRAKLSINLSIYVTTSNYVQELRVVTKRIKLQRQKVKWVPSSGWGLALAEEWGAQTPRGNSEQISWCSHHFIPDNHCRK